MKRNIFYMLLLALMITACQQNKIWEITKTENTIKSYQKYLSEYPDGKYADSAKLKIEQISWEQVMNEASIETFNQFLSEFPNGQYASKANKKIEEINWENAYLDASSQTERVILTTAAAGGVMSVVPYGREKLITIFNHRVISGNRIEISYKFEKEEREDLVLMAIYTEANIAAMTGSFHYFGRSYEMGNKSITFSLRPGAWVKGKTRISLYFLTPEDNRLSANKALAASNVLSFYMDYK